MSEKSIRLRAGAVILNNKKILLVNHKKNNDSYWLLPGGGVSYAEDMKHAVKRELSEELNISVKVEDFLFLVENIAGDSNRHIIHFYFSAEICGGSLKLGTDPRVAGYRYFSSEELEDIVVFPDIKKELKLYLDCRKCNSRFIKVNWIK